jgi:undecaprenyl-diphosphatase
MSRSFALIDGVRRGRATAIVTGAAAGLLALAIAVHGGTGGTGFDRHVDSWFGAHVGYSTALWFADLGSEPVVSLLVAAAVAACVALGSARGAVLAVVGPLLAAGLTEYVLKPIVDRRLYGYYAFPSGHTAGFGSVMLVVVIVLLGPARGRLRTPVRRGGITAALLLALGCMLGLIAAQFHYATDVIGGLFLVLASVIAVALAIDAVGDRLARNRSPGNPSASDARTDLPQVREERTEQRRA